MKSCYAMIALALALMLTVAPAAAQVSGRVTGVVVDKSGAVVPNATVNLKLAGGASVVLTTKTSTDGAFDLIGVRAEYYDLEVEAQGFQKYVLRKLKVDPAQQTNLPAIHLDVATTTQTVEVVANAQMVQTANAELTTTLSASQVANLPVLDRQVSLLFQTQAGVTNGRGPTTINGLRTSMANVTLDGVNIQDNFIRTNALDYLPNKLTVSQVSEFSVNTANGNASASGGAAQVVLVSPSGGNEFHGEGYWYNRNNYFRANTWFNNQIGNEKPFLNLNQLGGAIGGPIIKDKLFFHALYEAYRYKATSPTNFTVPTASARNGIFKYLDGSGVLREANVLALRGLTTDPVMQNMLNDMPAAPNNSLRGDGVNTGGYMFNARDNETRDAVQIKVDYNHTLNHVFSGTYLWNRDIVDRPDAGQFFTVEPPVYNDIHANLLSIGWRWTPTATLTNELRAGFNRTPGDFNVRTPYTDYIINNDYLLWDTPYNDFLRQGRTTNTYNISDTASWVRGKHSLSFGFLSQIIHTSPFNDAGILPTYNLEISTGNPNGLSQADLPGISSNDLANANVLLANLGGIVGSYSQDFNVTSRTSGFVDGATNLRRFSFNTYAPYISDTWRIRRNLTLTLGVRWEYYTRLNERDSLFLTPRIQGDLVSTLLNPDAVLDFAGNSAGRPYYKRDLNNFGPNVGFAWDVFGDGKTSIRGGYSIFYANDDTITAVRNNLTTNSGLQGSSSDAGLAGKLTGNLPVITVPEYMVPRTVWDNYALDPAGNAVGMPDPTLRTPYVQEWNLSVEREVKGFIVRARYIGNHMVKGLRAFDYNQVIIRENGFLDDFNRARSNGFLALNQLGVFDVRYNPSIAGSQQLTVFPLMYGGGLLTNSTVRGYILRGEPGTLGQIYFTNGLNGDVEFFRNPAALGTNTIASYSNSTYNAGQVDVTRRYRGVWLQANYTFSKVMSDAAGNGQTRFEAFLDNANPQIERARAPYDLTHVFKFIYTVPLPLGAQHRLSYQPLNRLLSGWAINGFVTWQSGTPFSIFSTRGTLNRASRSAYTNTADATITKGQLDRVVGDLYMTGNGPYFISPSVIGADGRGVASDGSDPFSGQVFFNPAPGTVGGLQRRMFSGPASFSWNTSISKETQITERQKLVFRADFYNFPNHPNFYVGDETDGTARFNVNGTSFGKLASTLNDSRILQFGLHYKF